MRRLTPLLAAVPALALTPTLAAQSTLYDVEGTSVAQHYGTRVATIGDVNGDGKDDFAVGAVEDSTFATWSGRVQMISGADGSVLADWFGSAAFQRYGYQVEAAGDVNDDGVPDVIVGAPGSSFFATPSFAEVRSGADFSVLHTFPGAPDQGMGGGVSGGGDLDGDSHDDVLVAASNETIAGLGEAGRVYAYSGATGALLYTYDGTLFDGELGRSMTSIGDVNGDGRDDWAVGSFNDMNDPDSYAAVVSGIDGTELHRRSAGGTIVDFWGHDLVALGDVSGDGVPDFLMGAPGFDCGHCSATGHAEVLSGADGSVVQNLGRITSGWGFGHAVANVGDLDLDGLPEIAVSQPGIPDGPFGLTGRTVHVYSTADYSELFTILGDSNGDRFGWSLDAADVDGDGQRELLVGAPYAPGAAGVAEGGLVRAIQFPAAPPIVYCTSKTNSLGCVPSMGAFGIPSATAGNFDVTCNNTLNNKLGLLFYGTSPKEVPFQGGWLCVRGPVVRTPVQDSGGNPPPNDCSGAYSFDMAARIASGVDPSLTVGQIVYCQWWYRDPADPTGFTTGRSDALRFRIRP